MTSLYAVELAVVAAAVVGMLWLRRAGDDAWFEFLMADLRPFLEDAAAFDQITAASVWPPPTTEPLTVESLIAAMESYANAVPHLQPCAHVVHPSATGLTRCAMCFGWVDVGTGTGS